MQAPVSGLSKSHLLLLFGLPYLSEYLLAPCCYSSLLASSVQPAQVSGIAKSAVKTAPVMSVYSRCTRPVFARLFLFVNLSFFQVARCPASNPSIVWMFAECRALVVFCHGFLYGSSRHLGQVFGTDGMKDLTLLSTQIPDYS